MRRFTLIETIEQCLDDGDGSMKIFKTVQDKLKPEDRAGFKRKIVEDLIDQLTKQRDSVEEYPLLQAKMSLDRKRQQFISDILILGDAHKNTLLTKEPPADIEDLEEALAELEEVVNSLNRLDSGDSKEHPQLINLLLEIDSIADMRTRGTELWPGKVIAKQE